MLVVSVTAFGGMMKDSPDKDCSIFDTPQRSLEQIATIQAEMPNGKFTPKQPGWTHLKRTHRILTEGEDSRHGYDRGGGGCPHYKEEGRIQKNVMPLKPDLMFIGGISQKDIESIREVIGQLRAALPDVENLLFTGTFGTADPRSPQELAMDKRSGAGEYGAVLKQLAAEQRCAFLNLTLPWADYIRSTKLHPHVFYRDRVHANEIGEQILSKILMAFFKP